jgi:hypothetical protein
MTGLHTPLHGYMENGPSRLSDMPFFTDTLKELGYMYIPVKKIHESMKIDPGLRR